MCPQRANLEIIAPSIEEAIEKGLTDLGLERDAVEVEVLDEGSRGLFGLGTRQARVRLTVKELPPQEAKPITPIRIDEDEVIPEPEPSPSPIAPPPAPEMDEKLSIAVKTVSELLEKMKITAQITAKYGEADDISGEVPIEVDIEGDDLSILIGKRSETLNALQYVARLIVSKELDRSVMLVIDVQGYRSRREKQIRQLARRMADQVIKTGRKQTLEPMPPSERRIVHMELREDPYVSTQSYGEEPHRKVTIIPKD
jgi:spoIIIJ-associated protein